MQVEQKRIFLNLRENVRGRYLRIAEVFFFITLKPRLE